MTDNNPLPEIAFYYPNPIWMNGDWVKNLILFFDGIGLLVPDYMKERLQDYDPAIVAGLNEYGLLHIIEPEKALDKTATENLASILTDVIVSDSLNILAKDSTDFHHLSKSRLGYYGDEGLYQMIFEELKKRGLAQDVSSPFFQANQKYKILIVFFLVFIGIWILCALPEEHSQGMNEVLSSCSLASIPLLFLLLRLVF